MKRAATTSDRPTASSASYVRSTEATSKPRRSFPSSASPGVSNPSESIPGEENTSSIARRSLETIGAVAWSRPFSFSRLVASLARSARSRSGGNVAGRVAAPCRVSPRTSGGGRPPRAAAADRGPTTATVLSPAATAKSTSRPRGSPKTRFTGETAKRRGGADASPPSSSETALASASPSRLCPSLPPALAPHENTAPDSVTATLCSSPAEICAARSFPNAAGSILVGVATSAVAPVPAGPHAPRPHANTSPLAAAIASEWFPPHATLETRTR